MHLLVTPEYEKSVMEPLGITPASVSERSADGFSAAYLTRGRIVLESGDGFPGCVCEITPEDKWLLDMRQDVFETECRPTGLKAADGGEIFSYFDLSGAKTSAAPETDGGETARIRAHMENNGIKYADIFLMIPGKLRPGAPATQPCRLCDKLNAALTKTCKEEFSGGYADELERRACGTAELEFDYDGEVCRQRVFSSIVTHRGTGFSVVEIGVPCGDVCGTMLLYSYTSGELRVLCGDKRMSVGEYAVSLGLELFGSKRSLVFSYSELSEEMLLNALVNEYAPMGKIIGDHFLACARGNLAQYDTAKAAASSVTFVEQIYNFESDIMKRLEYQAIEIFFIELLLMQDAGVSNVYSRLLAEEKIQRDGNYDINESKRVFENINFDMSQIQRFSDYDSFRFPTVRVSAERIAKAFGIDRMFEKYERNRELLDYMLDVNAKHEERHDNMLKNGLLLVLTLLSGMDVINNLMSDYMGYVTPHSYYISSAAVLCGVALYFIITAIRKGRRIHAKKRAVFGGKNGKDA